MRFQFSVSPLLLFLLFSSLLYKPQGKLAHLQNRKSIWSISICRVPRLNCDTLVCPMELLHPPEDCNVNSSLSFTLQVFLLLSYFQIESSFHEINHPLFTQRIYRVYICSDMSCWGYFCWRHNSRKCYPFPQGKVCCCSNHWSCYCIRVGYVFHDW